MMERYAVPLFVRSNDTPYDKRNYGEIIRTSDAFILNLDYFILISLSKYNVQMDNRCNTVKLIDRFDSRSLDSFLFSERLKRKKKRKDFKKTRR